MQKITDILLMITQALPEGIIFSDSEDMVIFANDAFCRIINMENKDIQGKMFRDFIAGNRQVRRVMEAEKNNNDCCAIYDTFLQSSTNEKISVRVNTTWLTDSNGSQVGILRTVINVTEEKRREYLSEQHQNLIQVFTNLLQHDLLNDIQVIIGYIESVLMLSTDLPPASKSMLVAARSTVLRMAGILSAFNQADQFIELDLVALLQRVIQESTATHMELDINMQIDEESGTMTVIGTPLLASAFHNLFRNAAKHAGGPSVQVSVTLRREKGKALITIQDDGAGIPAEKIKTIFKKHTHSKTNGIGLYLTRNIIRACGGSIRAISEPGTGAKFEIELPLLE
ncbi:MAG: PAS domain-containing sensor histidine kinase [Candidatus Thorarchaeota archaeon]|nr:PAS domain-containing sensor histidine kinase [Candidatus Thorarchaeota archaeon]